MQMEREKKSQFSSDVQFAEEVSRAQELTHL